MTNNDEKERALNNETITGTYEERLEALHELPMGTMVYTSGSVALFEFEKTASGLFEQMQYGKAVSTWDADQIAKWDALRIYRPSPSADLLAEIRDLLRKTDQAAFLGEITAVLHEIRDLLPESEASATQDAPAGRIGWLQMSMDARYLVREVEGGWSCDGSDTPDFHADNHPDAVFTPIATLPEGYVAVEREDLHCAVTVLDALDPFLDPANEPWLIRLRAALERSQS